MKKTSVLLLVLLLLAAAFTGCGGGSSPAAGSGENVHITVGHAGTEQTLMHQAWELFKSEVETNSGGTMTVEIYPNGQLGGDQQLHEAVQNGELTATGSNTAALTGFEPRLGVFATPFLFEDAQAAYQVLDGPFGRKMLTMMEESGFKALGYYDSVHFRVYSGNKAVHSPDDLKGVKIRVMQNPLHIAIWESLGANPTSISFSELYTALQQGTVDAQENPLELIVSQRFYEVQSHVVMTNHVFQVGMATMNLDFYNSLTQEQQNIVDAAATAAVQLQREKGAEEYNDYIATLEGAGIQIITLSSQQLDQFQEQATAAYPTIAAEVGQDLLDELLAAAS